MTKEQVYDEKISPLMAQIIKECHEHKISMVCTFSIPNDEDPDLECTTALVGDEFGSPDYHRELVKFLYRPKTMMINEKTLDGRIVRSTAFIA